MKPEDLSAQYRATSCHLGEKGSPISIRVKYLLVTPFVSSTGKPMEVRHFLYLGQHLVDWFVKKTEVKAQIGDEVVIDGLVHSHKFYEGAAVTTIHYTSLHDLTSRWLQPVVHPFTEYPVILKFKKPVSERKDDDRIIQQQN